MLTGQRIQLLVAIALVGWNVGVADGREDRVAKLNAQGIARFEQGQFVEAQELFRQALAIEPTATEIRTNLGKTFAALGAQILAEAATTGSATGSRKALESLQQALLYWQGDAETFHAIGWCHLHLVEFDAARRALERAIAFVDSEAKSWRLLSSTLERLNNLDGAIDICKRGLARFVGDQYLADRLHRLLLDQRALREFLSVEVGHFRLFHPPELPRERAVALLHTLTNVTEDLARRWAVKVPPGKTVICYPPGEFNSRTGLHEEVAGAYDGRIRIAFPTELEAGGLKTEQVIRHEAVHLMLHLRGELPPRWLDEGLAQNWDGESRADWEAKWTDLLKQSPGVSLEARERSLGTNRNESARQLAALYLHSYFFVRHLLAIGGEYRMDMVIREVGRGVGWEAALKSVYGKSSGDLEADWRASEIKKLSEPRKSAG
ncbi:MAG: tetratricopeptide repeat protein [Planctomycetota bacterium]